ncbi:bifunctional 5,10-methylenetetrahydrofolate dehydrogenase/5,10-methenyltetrahydrofolate cyclohydrolase [Hespellia stercorisuis]|uniref:Bifunctional protein FolD n=1 Tax=Hespellia stercorisuis DSM 15480 TaxID=1121950 RepID=A0A1M6MMP5_9FIRM|nr:tetrahydrofolate dehydrogenase/cyclohydrolase catalytic domain-containing protein [Hespellia stercorisuis]SHJ84694.1 methylenetetrahydrofolate dehydrogenase (NADP+) / methenyltetrahydrofolate cyclohydrolase [Hespellia stercorisuis DSM 15480]
MKEIRGAEVAKALKAQMTEDIAALGGYIPQLVIVRVGERPDDISYEKGAAKRALAMGLRCTSFVFDAEISHEEFVMEFQKINKDPEVDGILMLRPLPKQINEKEIERLIDPGKDIDCIGPMNLARVFAGETDAYAPCTAEAVMEMLKYEGIDLKGKRVTIVGRSLVVGKPLAMLMLGQHATVTICHTRTADFQGTCHNAEILVAAAGKAKMIKKEHVADGAIVIDVGINLDEEGNLCGDVDYEEVKKTAGIVTPVPGGVGSVTTLVLLKHLIQAAKQKRR